MPIACPHFSISIRQRSKGQSAVAGAAYQSGESLQSEYDGKTKNYRYKSNEVIAKGILLPPNAPRSYADRQTLWNAVEKSEKQWNAQLARGIIIALPNEIPKEQYEQLIRAYCQQQFVDQGMIVDYAIHDKGEGNPHAHLMLTMRALDERGQWLPKSKKVYDLDEKDQKIRLPSGAYKTHKENTVDWNDRGKAEAWRTAWAEIVNIYLERLGRPERIDLRSYVRQGKTGAPTIHLGPAVAHMEQKGIQTQIGDYNRSIQAYNKLLNQIKKLLKSLTDWLKNVKTEISQKTMPDMQPTVGDFVRKYMELRRQGRVDWGYKSKQTAGIHDLKFEAAAFRWMTDHNIRTLDDFNGFVTEEQEIFSRLNAADKEIKKLQTSLRHMGNHEKYQLIYVQSKRGFKLIREKYNEAHKDEINAYIKAVKYMKANGLQPSDREKIKEYLATLEAERKATLVSLEKQDIDPDLIQQIQHCIQAVLDAGEIPEHQVTIDERLRQPLPYSSKAEKLRSSEKNQPNIA